MVCLQTQPIRVLSRASSAAAASAAGAQRFSMGGPGGCCSVLRVHCASGSVVSTPHAGNRTQCPSRSDYQRRYDLSRGGGRGSKCRRPLRTWGFPTAPNKKTQFKQENVLQLIIPQSLCSLRICWRLRLLARYFLKVSNALAWSSSFLCVCALS